MHKSALGNGGTEGKEGQLHELEGLQTQGNADDGDAADDPREQVAEGHFPAHQHSPDDVGDGMLVEVAGDLLAEGGEGELGGLEALGAQGDPDDGDAEQQTQQSPAQTQPESAENEPDDVGDEFHNLPPECGTERIA